MRLVSFVHEGIPGTGALVPGTDDLVDFTSDAADLPQPEDACGWFDLDGDALPRAAALLDDLEEAAARREELREEGAVMRWDEVTLRAPVPRPGKIICIGLNYRDHAAEAKAELPARPLAFSKFASCATGHLAPVIRPPGCEQLDYEAELAVVIGRRACRVSEASAEDHVLGYCCFNDVSARDFQFPDGQWQRGKSCDTFAPFGPYIATREEIPDPHRLHIRFRLNGTLLQDSNTDQLIHQVPKLVSTLSHFTTLEPGDVIATGTPPGVGFARTPPVWVRPGDVMEVEIGGLGVLRNPVRAWDDDEARP